MPVSQRFIDLLNAPLPVLRAVARSHEMETRGVLKWDLARRLAQMPRPALDEETHEFLYAGSTSLSWLRLIPEAEDVNREDSATFYPMRGVDLPAARVIAAIHESSEGDPFSEEDRPGEIDQTPKLVVAREWDDGDAYILTFAVAKRTGHVIHNFEQIPVLEDEFFNALLRPGAGSIEVRASAGRVRQLERSWVADFAARVGCQAVPVAITQDDWRDLHDALGAYLDTFSGKTTTGMSVFDTQSYSKAPDIPDLLGEQEFEDETGDLEPLSMSLVFDDPELGSIRVQVSVLNGSLFIRTSVPERIIRYVREVLEQIKANRGVV